MVHVMNVHFIFCTVLKNLKSSFSLFVNHVNLEKKERIEDNVTEYALDIFIENATKMVWVIPLNAKNGGKTLR